MGASLGGCTLAAMAETLILLAHPQLRHSRVHARLQRELVDQPGLALHETFLLPYQQIARFTGLEWQPPWVFHDAHRASDAALAAHALALRQHLQQER